MGNVYRSDIPSDAIEEVIERYPSGARKTSRYSDRGQVVGARGFLEFGLLELETPRHNGLRHGTEYQWDDTGKLRSAIPYRHGLEHGTTRQWGPDGELIGSYSMRDGTGVDVWRDIAEDGSIYISEVRHFQHGERDGVEWFISHDHLVVREMTYRAGVEHGILREWEADGRLSPGCPAFFVQGSVVTLAEYQQHADGDASLPEYRSDDDEARRVFTLSEDV